MVAGLLLRRWRTWPFFGGRQRVLLADVPCPQMPKAQAATEAAVHAVRHQALWVRLMRPPVFLATMAHATANGFATAGARSKMLSLALHRDESCLA